MDEEQYHDARDESDDANAAGGGDQGEDTLYAQWLQNFRDGADASPNWLGADSSDDDFQAFRSRQRRSF